MLPRIAVILLLFCFLSCNKKPADRFVTLNGKNQHILDLGSGEPVVIFVSGFGGDLGVYSRVQPAVSLVTRTFAFDRAGVEKSELTDSVRSLEHMVFELNAILEEEDIEEPFILVGHSYGGYIVRYFAHAYPDKVAGLILIDPSVEYLDDEFRRLRSAAEIRSYDSLYEYGRDPSWPEGVKREANYFRGNESTIKKIQFPDDVPITVLTAMKMPESRFPFLKGVNQIKLDLHKRWLADRPEIKHVLASNSGHHIQLDEPILVINEIKSMIAEVK